MAHKIVDGDKLDEGMRATANAIRQKLGTTDKIKWQDNIGFASNIENIVGGGGTGGGTIEGLNYTSGTVEFTAGNYVIQHNLGVAPKVLFMWTEPSVERQNACLGIIYQNVLPQSSVAVYEDRATYTAPKVIADYPECVKEITDTYVKLTHRSSTYPILTGVTYNWLAIDTDESEESKSRYEQGFEDGKNSVVPLERYLKTATFTSLNVFGKKEVELNFDSITEARGMFNITEKANQNTIVEKLTINCSRQITSIMNMFYCNGANWLDETLKHLTLNVDTQKCTAFSNAFNGMSALEIIDGQPLDFSSVTNVNYMSAFNGAPKIVEFRVVSNSIKLNFNISKLPNLSTETIQSIIDGLADLSTKYYQVGDQISSNTFEYPEEEVLIKDVVNVTNAGYTMSDGAPVYSVTYGTSFINTYAYAKSNAAQTLTLHADVKAKLTETQLETIQAKNWELA